MNAGWSFRRRARWVLLLAALLQVLGAVAEPIVHAAEPAVVDFATEMAAETNDPDPSEAAPENGCGCFLCRAPGFSASHPHLAVLPASISPAPTPVALPGLIPPFAPPTGYLSRGPPLS
jgi:hypothetical protein